MVDLACCKAALLFDELHFCVEPLKRRSSTHPSSLHCSSVEKGGKNVTKHIKTNHASVAWILLRKHPLRRLPTRLRRENHLFHMHHSLESHLRRLRRKIRRWGRVCERVNDGRRTPCAEPSSSAMNFEYAQLDTNRSRRSKRTLKHLLVARWLHHELQCFDVSLASSPRFLTNADRCRANQRVGDTLALAEPASRVTSRSVHQLHLERVLRRCDLEVAQELVKRDVRGRSFRF